MPNNKKKSVDKIKGLDRAHPYSRKAVQLNRAIHREETLKKKALKTTAQDLKWERMTNFQKIVEDVDQIDNIHDFILQYINRHAADIEQLKAQVRPNRPKPPKLAIYQALLEKDMKEYENGIEIPNVADPKVFKILKNWSGDYNSISDITMTRIKKV